MKFLALLVAFELCSQSRADDQSENAVDLSQRSLYWSGRYSNSSSNGTSLNSSIPQGSPSDGLSLSISNGATSTATRSVLLATAESSTTPTSTGPLTSYGYSGAGTPYPTGGSSQTYSQTLKNWNVSGPATTADPCGPCIVYAEAGMEWWFPNLIYNNLASISTSRGSGFGNNMFSIISATSSFNVRQSMQNGFYTWVSKEYFDPTTNETSTSYDISASPLPTAALTVYATQRDVLPAPTGLIDATQLAKLYPSTVIEPFIAVPQATGSVFTATSSDNVVFYTSYEVEYPTATVNSWGEQTCVTSTASFNLSIPYAYTYADPMQTLGSQLAASGPVYPEFLNHIPQSNCYPGTWLAPQPTMLVVVEETYQRGFAILIAHHEVTVTDALSVPTPAPAGEVDNNGGAPSSSSPPTALPQNQGSSAPVVDNRPTPTTTWPSPGPAGGNSGGGKGASPITIGNQVYTPNAATEYYLAPGQTLKAGGTAVVSGAQISLQPDAAAVIINGQTQQIAAAPMITPPPAVVIINGRTSSLTPTLIPPTIQVAGTVYTELPGASFIIAGNTLRPGQAVTVAGATISLPAGADYIALNGQMTQLYAESKPAFVLGSSTYTAAGSEPSGIYVIAGQTLRPGGPAIVVAGTTLSIPALPRATGAGAAAAMMTNAPILTINGRSYTAAAGGTAFVIGGQTLTPGGVIVDQGTTISLAPSATALVVNGASTALFPATRTGVITSASAGSPSVNNLDVSAASSARGQSPSITTTGLSNSGSNLKQNGASTASLVPIQMLAAAIISTLLHLWL